MSEIADLDVEETALEQRLEHALEKGLSQRQIQAEIGTERVAGTELVRLIVVSDQFSQMYRSERQDLLWRIARENLNADDQFRISFILALTPDELGEESAA